MKAFTGLLVLLVVFISLRPGESYNLTMICKDEKASREPFQCHQPHCDRYCAKMHFKGWGKCKDDDRFVCECFHVCYKDTNGTTSANAIIDQYTPPPPPSPRPRDPK